MSDIAEIRARIAATDREISENNAKIAYLKGRAEASYEAALDDPEIAPLVAAEAALAGVSVQQYRSDFISNKLSAQFPEGNGIPTEAAVPSAGVKAFRDALR